MSDLDFIDDIYEVLIPLGDTVMSYRKGKQYDSLGVVITDIAYDQNTFFTIGVVRIKIYAKKIEGDEEVLWKILENIKCIITRDINK